LGCCVTLNGNKNVVLSTVPWLRGLIADLVRRRQEFDPMPVDIGFVMDEVILMKFWFSPVIVIQLIFYTHLHLQGKLAIPGNLQAKQCIVISGSNGRKVRVFVTLISLSHQRVGNVATPFSPVLFHMSFVVPCEITKNSMPSLSRNNQQDAPCNRIYYSTVH
jgi:hypothetical protein